MNPQKLYFRKAERLCSEKTITDLFSKQGEFSRISVYPFLLILKNQPTQTEFPAKVVFIVGKKHFKSAVVRNLIKRQMRELYRAAKPVIYKKLSDSDTEAAIAIIYTGKATKKFSELKEKFEILVEKLLEAAI